MDGLCGLDQGGAVCGTMYREIASRVVGYKCSFGYCTGQTILLLEEMISVYIWYVDSDKYESLM